jgi:hypothetical protein
MTPPGTIVKKLLEEAKSGTIYHKIYTDNMDKDTSYLSVKPALDKLTSESLLAHFDLIQPVYFLKEHQCQVKGNFCCFILRIWLN